MKTVKKSLKILFVQDSPCIRNYKMAIALGSRGHRISLAYTVKRLSQRYEGLSDDVYQENIHIKHSRQLWDISKYYDIIHCHNEPDVLTVAALAGDAPVVHDTHDLISLRSNGDPNLVYFEGVANRGSAGRVYSTSFQLEEAKKLYGVNGMSLVFNNYASAADLPQKFLPKLSFNDGKVHIVYEGGVGGIGHRDFTDIFIQLAMLGMHIHIYPALYDEEQDHYFSQFDGIHYNAPVSPKKIMEEMTQYDFGIIPFNIEKGNKRFLDSTIANKLYEYLAAGLPVITSPLKSYKHYFQQNKVGITFNSVQDIIENIDYLKKIAKSVDFTKQVYTFESEIHRLEDFYIELLNTSGKTKTTVQSQEEDQKDLISDATDKLMDWLEKNGWDGYDPYDIQDYYIQKEKSGTPLSEQKKQEINQRADQLPIGVREELGIEKKRNAKALGLLTKAWCRLYKIAGKHVHLDEAERIAEWLLQNPSRGYKNLCWGYPFDWQSVVFIPRGTPSAVVSTVVGDGFWELYLISRKQKYLDACISICHFITQDLKCDDMGDKGICFSYTPIDDYHVHNANLFCGEFLARVGCEIENHEWCQLAQRVAVYALAEQNEDGSIYYWGKIQNHNSPNHLDHYHSGFEIRCLFHLAQHLKMEEIKYGYLKYLKFYLKNYFLPDGTPKINPNNAYPVNIHGAAEGILTLSTLSAEHHKLLGLAQKTLEWTINHMQTSEGWFGHLWSPNRRVDAPYLRWGEAWMLRAISEFKAQQKIRSGEWGYYSLASNTPGIKAKISSSNTRKEELDELRELALSYAKLDNKQIPDHVINLISEKIDGGLNKSKKQQFILENLADNGKWQKVIDSCIEQKIQAKEPNTVNNRKNIQIMMPDVGQYNYGSKEWAETLFKNSGSDPWGHDWRASQKARYSAAMVMIKRNIPSEQIEDILDVGCALGDFTKMLKEYFSSSNILGVDISEHAILKSKRLFGNIKFEVSSLPELNVSGDDFDLVSALEVIYYVGKDNIDKSLKRIYSVVKKGGYILISTYLNKPPFNDSKYFKEVISKYFEIIDETIRYHGLYTQNETVIRQSMASAQNLLQILDQKSQVVVKDYINNGIKLLGDIDIINQLNDYTKVHIGEKGISHSIILGVKK